MSQDESSSIQTTRLGLNSEHSMDAGDLETTLDDVFERTRERTPNAGFDVHQSLAQTRDDYDHRSFHQPSDDSSSSFRGGDVVGGHFKLIRMIGEGGMGTVFVAKDTKLGRRVALKTLKVPPGLDEKQQARFIQLFHRDAASTARLNHPNIVTVHQFGEHEGTPFMVLEFVDGAPLDRLLHAQGPMGEREALMIALQMAEALEYAHEQGVIHRDIKPANLMRTKGGRLKVLDFGVALMKQAQEELIEAFERTPSQLGEHLGVEPRAAGTPAYMAPEQLRGLLQDERVDVWAFGVTLFEMLTGQRPYVSPWHVDEHFKVMWPEDTQCSAPTRQIVRGCLSPMTSSRTRRLGDVIGPLREAIGDLGFLEFGTRTNLASASEGSESMEGEFAELDSLLLERGERLVTLTGADVDDKVALFTKWGLDVLEREPFAEVLMCDLAEVTSAEGIAVALMDAMRLVILEDDDAVERLTAELTKRDKLVFLIDNAGEVLDELKQLLDRWLDEAPGVRFVLTSEIAEGGDIGRAVQVGQRDSDAGVRGPEEALAWAPDSPPARRSPAAPIAAALAALVGDAIVGAIMSSSGWSTDVPI